MARIGWFAHIYIVDNSFAISDKESVQRLFSLTKAYSDKVVSIHYIPSDFNQGFGSACNKAAMLSNEDLIVFANCDTDFSRTDAQGFESLINIFQDDSVAIVGPKIISESGLLHASCFSFDPVSISLKPLRHVRKIGTVFTRHIPRYRSFKKRIDRITYEGMPKDIPVQVDWVSGCLMITSNDFFHSVQGFDERYFLYFEDVDLCRKARQLSKLVLFDPRVEVIHIAAHQSARNKGIARSLIRNRTARHHIRSWLRYCLKWKTDFVEKMILLLKRLPAHDASRKKQKYLLDFSVFKAYRE